MYEYRNGRVCRTVQALYNQRGGGRGHYRVGDAIDGGRQGLRELKKMFPDSKVQEDELTFWQLVDAVIFGNQPTEDYQLIYRIDAIDFDPRRPWVGSIEVRAFVQLGEDWIPLEQPPKDRRLQAWANGGLLNEMLPRLAMNRSLYMAQKFLGGVLAVSREMLMGVVSTAARGTKWGRALLKSKFVTRLEDLEKHLGANRLTGAIYAFADTFSASVSEDLKSKNVTPQQLVAQGATAVLPLAPVTRFVHASITLATNAKDAANPTAPTATVKYDVQKAVVNASMDFAYRLLIPKGMLERIGDAAAKRLVGRGLQKRTGELVAGLVDESGKAFLSEAISTAALKANQDTKGSDSLSFKDHLKEAVAERAMRFFTIDRVQSLTSTIVEWESEKRSPEVSGH
jgi:hypothetical protein